MQLPFEVLYDDGAQEAEWLAQGDGGGGGGARFSLRSTSPLFLRAACSSASTRSPDGQVFFLEVE